VGEVERRVGIVGGGTGGRGEELLTRGGWGGEPKRGRGGPRKGKGVGERAGGVERRGSVEREERKNGRLGRMKGGEKRSNGERGKKERGRCGGRG